MSDCIFCQIVSGSVPAEVVHQDDDLIAFRDINPNAPIHFLVVPREHHPDLDTLSDQNLALRLLTTARKLGEQYSPELGYRLMVNSNKQAEINHLHYHVLGGLTPEQPLQKGGGTV